MKFALLLTSLLLLSVSPASARLPRVELNAAFLSAPHPEYPFEARRDRMRGAGVFRIFLDQKGNVTNVTVVKTTGRRILDEAASKTLSRWRARPSNLRQVDVPITFKLVRPAA